MRDLRGDDGLQLSRYGQREELVGPAGEPLFGEDDASDACDENEVALVLPSTGRAAGKAILVGEHFVVHGAPALAVPVPVHIEVRLARSQATGGPLRVGPAIGIGGLETMLRELGLEEAFQGIDIAIAGPLPLGAGLGGSAALAAAFSQAWAEAKGRATGGLELAAAVHRLERLAHGNPSGLDGMAVALGRAIWFSGAEVAPAGDEGPDAAALRATLEARYGRAAHATVWVGGQWVSALALQDDAIAGASGEASASLPLTVAVVLRHGTTREAVAGVATWKSKHPEAFEGLMRETRALAEAAREALTTHDWPVLGRALDAAHAPLKALGLVSAEQEQVVIAARKAGAFGAKMSGAGLGGAIVVLGPEGLDFGPVLRHAGAMQVFTTASRDAPALAESSATSKPMTGTST